MRAVEIVEPGGPDVLRAVERASHEPGPGEVVIRNEAVGVNFADLWARLSSLPGTVPGIECAGVVRAVGADVARVAPGDRVVGLPYFALGAYAEESLVPATHVFPVPDALELDVAAAIPVNYLTAYLAVVRTAQVRSGERVLVHAAAGGVGIAATQLVAAAGAQVIATASPGKHEFVAAQPGVVAVVDYTRDDWDDEVRRLSKGGVDVVVDGIGEDGFAKSLRTLAFGGRLAAFGLTAAMTDANAPSTAEALGLDGLTVPALPLFEHGWSFGAVTGDAPPALLDAWLDDLFARVVSGELSPRVAETFALADAADAHRFLHERRNVGKVMLAV